ncbi:acetyl-CoA C-acetyltransferase [Leifsonia shinshuensis]|uniref:acetyl-CoA C-acetyltransferase n=1 Tax=Leifsonia shinshuensis TaxID=150026 RepID=UPI002864473A|nr:acetyl-CoA C-acetyltransferase [Leifsonia shinshuensis]MDR6972481.1 acetyl-CoA C-acetyltransferase [Leifsonia shinshuensis]
MSSDDVVILSAARTPLGKIKGTLASLTAVQLGTIAVQRALERSGVGADAVDTVLFGQVLQAGAGQNPARQTAIGAGIGWDVPATTINKVCLSGLAAVIDAARLIRTGEATVVVAGGQESMTNAPHILPGSRMGWNYGSIQALDSAAHDGLTDAFDGESMGASTEKYTEKLGLRREAQDEFAARSHQRAGAAAQNGVFADEIAPVTIPQRKGDPVIISTDEGVRPDSTPETLAGLRPSFAANGTLTAGNSSPLSDGAAALVLTSRENAERLGLEWLALVGASGQVAGPDNSLHSQPSRAIDAALRRAGWSVSELDLIEINEAFAAVALQSMSDLGLDPAKVNIHGGAIALGHPIGASGARLAGHAAHELARRGAGRAAVALCGGGGQGEALLLYR